MGETSHVARGKERRMLRFLRVSIVVAALLALNTVPGLAAGHGRPVPVHGAVLTWGPEPDVTGPGCVADPSLVWRFSRDGTGQLSHLGSVGIALSHCTYVVPDASGAFRAVFRDGTITFTAANRDTLVLAYTGTTEALMGPGGFTGYTAEGTWTVVDGTGRFTHATGSGWFDVVGDVPGGDTLFGLPDGFDRWSFGGTIAYDASDRSS